MISLIAYWHECSQLDRLEHAGEMVTRRLGNNSILSLWDYKPFVREKGRCLGVLFTIRDKAQRVNRCPWIEANTL